jgi:phenylalanyl-tRNA synthetase beta chain
MQISLNWLRSLLDIQLSAAEIARILTSTGLEVEHFETTYSVKGGLKDLRVAEVLEKWKHPNADKLNVTKVNLGSEIVQIVCGASNVDAGQKVVVAPVGAFVHPIKGDAFQIQKAKIRGEVSEGMICAEDEISLGESHAGIMVLPSDAKVGTLASEYFKIQEDTIFEIGLTPNRADAASHWGVARDIIAYAELHNIPYKVKLEKSPKVNYGTKDFQVNVLSKEAAPRFAGLVLSNIQVSDSPDWLRNALLSIGLSPINNIVDITNYIQHTLGQPMHAYDMSYVGNAINVEVLDKPQEFEFLDGKKSKETQGDLFICNAQHQPMCLAGIFGGKHSGVGTNTTSIFLEAAYFNPVQIRKSSKKHGLKTDASFRFERGVDIQNTVNALNFAAKLILDICPKAVIESKLIDIQQDTVANKEVKLSLTNLKRLAGFEVETDKLNKILKGLEIEMKSKSADEYHLSIPRYRVDLDREIDVIEDILRIYGFDNIPFSSHIALNLNGKKIENFDKEQKKLSNYLVSQGFYEIMNNSLGAQKFEKGVEAVQLLNPLSNELNTLRTHLLSGHLQTIAFNQNRKNANARFFEFGSVYSKKGAEY